MNLLGVREARSHTQRGFTKLELILTLTVLVLLTALILPKVKQTKVLIVQANCTSNLEALGRGMSLYSQNNGGALPYAQLHLSNQQQTTWDKLIESDTMGTGEDKSYLELLVCPEDTIPVASWAAKFKYQRRTYSMPRHSMYPNSWPPGPDNLTGVGLFWSFGADGKDKPKPSIYNYENPSRQAKVLREMILSPSSTILLTERAWSNNIARNSSGSYIARATEHLDTNQIARANYHGGRINYLMVDGHVESLLPEETVGPNGRAGDEMSKHLGMWTIRSTD